MEIIYLTLLISLILSFSFLGLFIWSNSKGQYDDLTTPGYRIFMDDENTENNEISIQEEIDEFGDKDRQ